MSALRIKNTSSESDHRSYEVTEAVTNKAQNSEAPMEFELRGSLLSALHSYDLDHIHIMSFSSCNGYKLNVRIQSQSFCALLVTG